MSLTPTEDSLVGYNWNALKGDGIGRRIHRMADDEETCIYLEYLAKYSLFLMQQGNLQV
jgi:hypothetical protein